MKAEHPSILGIYTVSITDFGAVQLWSVESPAANNMHKFFLPPPPHCNTEFFSIIILNFILW